MATSAVYSVPPSALQSLSPESRKCIERLRAHRVESVDVSDQPRLAAVLVLLYEKANQLRVLLTTRSKFLRTHPGETALPGGKMDEGDVNALETAYREANEEVGLPLHCHSMHTVCILRPFLSNRKVVVRPVVALLTDLSVLDQLKASEDEVQHIFDHPLEAFLDPSLVSKENLTEKGSANWPYDDDLHNTNDRRLILLGNASYRMHRFRSTASPVKGLTAEILLTAAEIAYGRLPTFERYAPEQSTTFSDILRILAPDDNCDTIATSGTETSIGVAAGVQHASCS